MSSAGRLRRLRHRSSSSSSSSWCSYDLICDSTAFTLNQVGFEKQQETAAHHFTSPCVPSSPTKVARRISVNAGSAPQLGCTGPPRCGATPRTTERNITKLVVCTFQRMTTLHGGCVYVGGWPDRVCVQCPHAVTLSICPSTFS